MRIRKYDFDYGRRMLAEKIAKGVFTGGVLAPLWSTIANSADITRAYPEELLHIEAYTKGKVKPGDVITADNVRFVQDLLDPITFEQVKTMGRRINIVETTRDVTQLFPYEYLQATIKNHGRARLDSVGNVYQDNGEPWGGGMPFAQPKNGIEALTNLVLNWGRHDFSMYAMPEWDIGPDGSVGYKNEFFWAELNVNARVDGTSFHGDKDRLRLHTVVFTYPQDIAGSAFLSLWHYDQRKFPELYGYLPTFKRVRQFPTNQRFEPLVAGPTWFLSDGWAQGDPLLTWGNFQIVERRPMLGALSRNWYSQDPNWIRPVHGGPQGVTFWNTSMELVPETIVVQSEPTGYPRAPVGKKKLWIDVRTGMFVASNTYDRRGQVWKSFEAGFSQYVDGKAVVMDGAHPAWSWTYYMCHDLQSNRLSRGCQARQSSSGPYHSAYSAKGLDIYNKFFTVSAIGRLGSA